MAFHLHEQDDQGMSEINLIPLIDIMLVLMIIFLVTASVIPPSVPLSLPKTNASVQPLDPQVVNLSINASGDLFVDQQPINAEQLGHRFAQMAKQQTPPTLHIRADENVRYQVVAEVMAQANRAGLQDLAFISDAQAQ